mgnify:CR=1 FL=1
MSQLGAATALLDRDLRAFLRSRSQLYSSVLFPLMLLAVLGTGVSEGLDPGAVRDYVTFLVPGVIVMTALFSSTFSSATYYADRDSGILKVFLASPNPRRTVLLAKMAGAVTVGCVQALLVLGIAAILPAVDFAWQYGTVRGLALALAAILLLNLLLAALGQWLSQRISSMQGFHLVMNLVLFPFLFFSGAFFPLDDLPLWLRVLGAVNPLSYAVDALQLATYAGEGDSGYFGVPLDLAVLVALTAALLFAAASRRPDDTR